MPQPVSLPAPEAPVVRLLPIAAALWLGYSLVFFAADQVAARLPISPAYYLLNDSTGFLLLGLAWWPAAPARLGRAFLPLVIGLMSVPPLLSNYLLLPRFGPGGPFGGGAPRGSAPALPGPTLTAEGIALRLLPVLLLAVVLTAWHYRWPQVLLYCLGTAAVSLSLRLDPLLAGGGPPARSGDTSAAAPVSPFIASLIVVSVQTLCLLIAGYFMSVLVRQLRAQQTRLAETNHQLRQHAGTLENLNISRERNRVARELHDTLAHTLSGLTVQLETVEAYWAIDPAQAQALLAQAEATARSGLQETRQALAALRASPLEDLGLVLALRQLAEDAAARARLQLELAVPDSLEPLPPDVEQCLYRVAQEAIANVVYHANAQRLAVALCGPPAPAAGAPPALTRLIVHDDGTGFTGTGVTPGHYGLAGMRERARLIGGYLTIDSRPGGGTTVELQVPAGGDGG